MRLLAFAILLSALPAQAYQRALNSANVCTWWSGHGHSFQIASPGTPDLPDADAFAAIRRSFATWAAVSCSDLTFPEEALSTAAKDRVVGYFDGVPNHNLVLFRTQACRDVVPAGDICKTQGGCSNKYDCWDQGDAVIASTTTTSNRRTGEILDTDIELNNAPAANGTRFTFTAVDGPPCTDPGQTGCVRIDVQNTVTHEAGHSLGLDHVPDHPEACMYPNSAPGEVTKRTLAADDIQGICAVYPRGAATVKGSGACAPTDSGGGCGSLRDQTGPGAALGSVLLLLLQIRRRSRRRPQLAMSSSTNPATAPRFQSGSEN